MQKLIPVLLVGFLYGQAPAASRLLNYENRVVRAAEQIERIKSDSDYSEEGIEYIKKLLPRSEQVEVEGRESQADNTWLYVLLDSYAAEKDQQQRLAKLNEAAGRLRALDEHLRIAEAGDPGSAGNSREKIREILSRPPYQPEHDTAIGAFVKSVLREVRSFLGEMYSALRRLLEKIFGASAQSGWFSNVLLIIVLAAAVIVAARLATRMRGARPKRKKTRVVLGEEIAADGTSRELAEAALAAARAGDFRTAIRKLYVSLLYELSERNLIELEDSATNHEYLQKVQRFQVLEGPMIYMTDRFDHVWYGMFSSSEEDFAAYMASYQEAMHKARKLGEQAAAVT